METGRTLKLTFTLPATLAFAVSEGRVLPCLAGTLLTVDKLGQVNITGKARDQVFEQAERWLGMIAKQHPPRAIHAVLSCDKPGDGWPARDSWWIVIGGRISFSPSRLPPELPGVDFAFDAANEPAGSD
jgi:hypothetical protein